MIKVAIIDTMGVTYSGYTPEHMGLGGSESAVVYAARELAKAGFNVTVFNSCNDGKRAQPGVYDGVAYMDIKSQMTSDKFWNFDVVISSRSVVPFVDSRFDFTKKAKLKVLWLHDTFCYGDHLVESLIVNREINEIWTLSDFHTSYVLNCEHGAKRNFEVLKRHTFVTRNGIVRRIQEIDFTKKDPNLFVYNASATKGMFPLVNEVWPRVKSSLPNAKLKIVGGFYKFGENTNPDSQELAVRQLMDRNDLADLDVEFLGVIRQKEVADLLAKASFTIYPGAFPETYGISTLESLAYKTPVITTRFGALEETAIEQACYLLDYAIEPNSLFPNINKDNQVFKFVDLVVSAYNDRYLHQQKMNYCEVVRSVEGWDTVIAQWKQHIYKKLGLYLPVDDFRKVNRINHNVHRIFGRSFSNAEEWGWPKNRKEKKIVVIVPFYNAANYIRNCIKSVAQQDYENYQCVLVNDCSTDRGILIARSTLKEFPKSIKEKFTIVQNLENFGAVKNQYNIIQYEFGDIYMLLDGDDSLVNDNTIFNYYNELYHDGAEFTYGSCWSLADDIPLIAQPYPEHIKKNKEYRKHLFNWGLPYTHLRTFSVNLRMWLKEKDLQDKEGNWYRAGGDNAMFYALIEAADPENVIAVPHVMVNYNDLNPLNDYKVNGEEQNRNAADIRNRNAKK